MLDWTGTTSNIRSYGTNAHHDTVWTASSTGSVSATLRYDPFGTLTSSTGSLPDFRFQGSWFDGASSLSWVVTRWYAPSLGRFLSEDSLLGEPNDPPSRHLYAYGAGEPIARWDPDGAHWYVVRAGNTLWGLAQRFYGNGALNWRITRGNPGGVITPINLNHARATLVGEVGKCIWIPFTQLAHQCKSIRGDSTQPGAVLWGTFDKVRAFTLNKMLTNAKDGADGLGNWTSCWIVCDAINAGILKRMSELFCTKCAWDIKWDINQFFGGGVRAKPFWHAVRDDPAPESFRSDLWGLMHYGYVSRAHGVPVGWIALGNQIGGGVQGPDDNLAIAMGVHLWEAWGRNVNAANLKTEILANMGKFRGMVAENAVRPPLATWFR